MANPSRTIQVKFDGDTKGLAAAAKNGERIVDRFADNSARTFTSKFRSWFTGRGADDANTVGRFFARTFGTGLLSGFSVPVFGPVLIGVLLGAVAVAAPVIGAALATGVVAAFGAGIVGLGVVFAAQSQQVKNAFSDLKDSLVSDLRLLAKPFEDTLIRIAGFIQRTFDSFAPVLADVFAQLGPVVTRFADQFFRALDHFKPAITAVSDAFSDLLGDLGPKLPALFDDVANTIENIAGTISEHSETFASLITFFADAADKALEFVGALANAYGEIANFLTSVNEGISNASRVAIQNVTGFSDAVSAGLVAGLGIGTEAVGKWSGTMDGAKASTDGYAQSLRDTSAALTAYAAAQLAATDPVFALLDAVTQADEAQSTYNEAVKEFGATSPQAAAAAIEQAQAVARLEQAALNGEISFGAFDRKLREWVDTGQITAGQADTIRAKVKGARGEAENFQGTYEATVKVRDHATAALQGIRAWLRQIQSKTITITARADIPAGVSVRQLMEMQHGGRFRRGDVALVGEQGAELVRFEGSGEVVPHSKTMEMLRGQRRSPNSVPAAPSGGRLVLEIHSGGSRLDDLLVQVLSRAVRVRGGDVQTVLGS